MKLNLAAAAVAVRLGDRDAALSLIDFLGERVDGCGTSADRNDWITDCDSQVGFRELLVLYRRGVATLPLPDPYSGE